MSSRRNFWGVSLLIVIALVLAGTRSHLSAQDDNQQLTGSWNGVVTVTNAPGVPPIKDLLTFIPGGGVVEAHRLYNNAPIFGPLLFTPGHGAWESTADNQFAVTTVDFFQAAPNNPVYPADGTTLGQETVRWNLTLNQSGQNLSGSLAGVVTDSNGNVIFTFSANLQAKRIHAL